MMLNHNVFLMTSTTILYQAAGFETCQADSRCWLCGGPAFDPIPRREFVKPTFTDHDKVACSDSDVVCAACVFCHDERSEGLASLIGKEKPQRMRNYSHFVVDGKWIPLSKADKARIADLLLNGKPELAIIAVSGQKHLIFRAQPGWWQIEEQAVQPFPDKLRSLLNTIEALYTVFSKSEIEAGSYAQYRVRKFGLTEWWALESQIKPGRGSLPFQLALFLAQKGDGDDTGTRTGGGITGDHLAGDPDGLQEPLSEEYLATIRGQHPVGGLHQQPGQIHQLALL